MDIKGIITGEDRASWFYYEYFITDFFHLNRALLANVEL